MNVVKDVGKTRRVCAPAGIWGCSFGVFGEATKLCGSGRVYSMLRYRYLELPPQRSGLSLRMLSSLLTYVEVTKSFLVPLWIMSLIEVLTAG